MFPKVFKKQEIKFRIKRIDGRVCPIFIAESQLAKRLSGLTQIKHDLNQAKELISLIETIDNANIRYSLWMSAIVTYAKCFASAGGRGNKLELHHVKKYNPDAVEYHKALIELRNQYFAHAGQNDYEESTVGILLAPEEEGKKILEIQVMTIKKASIAPEEALMFSALCDGLLSIVQKMGEEVDELVFKEHKAMDINKLYKKARR